MIQFASTSRRGGWWSLGETTPSFIKFRQPAMLTWSTGHTVDGWNPANQLRLVVYPIISRVSYIPGGARFQPSTVGPSPSSGSAATLQVIVTLSPFHYPRILSVGEICQYVLSFDQISLAGPFTRLDTPLQLVSGAWNAFWVKTVKISVGICGKLYDYMISADGIKYIKFWNDKY